MATPDPKRLQDQIDWQFTAAQQGQLSRYGTFAGGFYKQFLPAGLDLPSTHPPRRIDEKVYRFIERIAASGG